MSDKDIMSANRLAAVNEETARLNARAVVQRMSLMQEQLDGYKLALDQQAKQIALLNNRFDVEQQLRAALQNGSGPTVG